MAQNLITQFGILSHFSTQHSWSHLFLCHSANYPLLLLIPMRTIPSSRARPNRRLIIPTRPISQKMYVPGFGEKSPEAKAAINLHKFFTYVAVRIVLAQLESYNTEAHKELMEFVDRNSLKVGDRFCADLMRESPRHKAPAMRILEVRSSYCKEDFEWDNLQRLAAQFYKTYLFILIAEY